MNLQPDDPETAGLNDHSLAPASVPDRDEGVSYRPLHPAVRRIWMIGGLIGVVAFGAIVGVVELSVRLSFREWPLPWGVGTGLVTVGLAVAVILYTPARFRSWRFAVRDDAVLVEWGVLWRMRRCVPRMRVQHVDIESGPVSRAFGMVTLSLYTAGTVTAVAAIPGLSPEDAEALREELLVTERPHG